MDIDKDTGSDSRMRGDTPPTRRITAPTIGRIVLVRLDETDTGVRPAVVYWVGGHGAVVNLQHFGPAIYIAGDPGPARTIRVFGAEIYYDTAKRCLAGVTYGERAPGDPALGCWCWPAMSRAELEVPV